MTDGNERGQWPHIDRDGGVHGSGAGAGGGNPGEDYDVDPVSGGGEMLYQGSRSAGSADRPKDKSPGGSA
jgi:hypothetical protein